MTHFRTRSSFELPGEHPGAGPGRAATLGFIALLCVIWGSTWFVIEDSADEVPPLMAAGIRFTVAAAAMALLSRPLARREGGLAPPVWLVLVVGTLNFAVSYGIVYTVETRLPSGLVSVLWGTFPLGMAVAGHVWIPGERLAVRQAGGFGLGFLGVVVLFAADLPALGPGALGAGLLLLLSPFVSVVGQTVLKLRGAATSSVLLNRNAMALGAVLLLSASAVWERGQPASFSPRVLGGIAYLALVGTVLSFGLYFWLLRHGSSHRLALISYVTPVVALWLGVQFGTDELRVATLCGTGLVIGGIALVRSR